MPKQRKNVQLKLKLCCAFEDMWLYAAQLRLIFLGECADTEHFWNDRFSVFSLTL